MEHAAEPVQQQKYASVAHGGDARTISLRVTGAADQKVELQISDHAGEVKVAVRASDPDLAGALRENLGELVHKLEQSGLRADNWHAAAPDSPSQVRQTGHTDGESLGGDHSGRQQHNQGDSRDRRQQDRQQHPAWMEELESSFKPDSERSSNIWLRA
jgi:hypothetical protein